MAHHKVFGDLLHVLKVEEGVEAKLVCKDTPLSGRKQRTGIKDARGQGASESGGESQARG